MKRTPEQLAARKARQMATLAMPKCCCGNVVKKGTKFCSRCAALHAEWAEAQL